MSATELRTWHYGKCAPCLDCGSTTAGHHPGCPEGADGLAVTA